MTTSSVPLRFDCQYCGLTFYPKRRGAGTVTKYCNWSCYLAARRARGRDDKDRRSARYAQWRAAVLARDVVCQGVVERDGRTIRCGATQDLHAHHIKNWREHPAERYRPENGVLLCYDCHKRRHPHSGIGRRRAPVPARVCTVCGAPITRSARTGMCYRHAIAAYSASRGDSQWEQVGRRGKTCRTCGARIGDKNVSGYCLEHMAPYIREKKRAQGKLDRADVETMRARYAAGGVTFKQLGLDYGVSTVTAFDAVRGRRWKD